MAMAPDQALGLVHVQGGSGVRGRAGQRGGREGADVRARAPGRRDLVVGEPSPGMM
jgi:hypothetical protein